jgi:hypothetical protein
MSRRLDELPGLGPTLATALVVSVADPKLFLLGGATSSKGHPEVVVARQTWNSVGASRAHLELGLCVPRRGLSNQSPNSWER